MLLAPHLNPRALLVTEIDWETYMEQTALYIKGERNYARIEGPTGPLVCVTTVFHCCPRLTDV